MKRHAYLLLVHTNPKQVKKLLRLLDHEDNDIYMHIDKRSCIRESSFEGICTRSRLEMIQRRRVSWGGVSMMEAELDLLKAAVPGGYLYYHLLSGMDLPLKTQDEIHEFFDRNSGKEFFTMWPVNEQTYDSVHYKTIFPENNRFIIAKKLKTLYRKYSIRKGLIANEDISEKFASQWFSITHGFAAYVVQNEAWIRETFSNTGQSDEIFMPTLLFRSPFAGNLYDSTEYDEDDNTHLGGSMRYIDWRGHGMKRHPRTLDAGDFEMLMNSGILWARKFDERKDPEIIDMIYNTLSARQKEQSR